MFISNSSPVIINASFSENIAQNVGGGIFSEGSSLSKFTNITFNSNSANSGGAIYNSGISSLSIKNCIFWKNKKNGNINTSGADIQIGSSPPSITTVSNSLLQLNNNNTNYPTVGFSFYSINVFNQDPLFFNESDVDGDDNLLGTYDDGLIPKPCSPVINKGENTGVTSLDIIGNNRISDGIVDMGAYEAQLNNSLNLVLSNPINNIDSNIGNLKAINSINATNIVDTSGKVNYLSGHIINLNAGFEVKSGAIFKATIEGCN